MVTFIWVYLLAVIFVIHTVVNLALSKVTGEFEKEWEFSSFCFDCEVTEHLLFYAITSIELMFWLELIENPDAGKPANSEGGRKRRVVCLSSEKPSKVE